MDVTFAVDFTSTEILDSELIGTPDSGLYWNRGVHPILTVNNLLKFLPNIDITPTAWSNASTYGIFETSRKLSDVVTSGGLIYLSKTASNFNNEPPSAANWQLTNLNSLRIRSFIWSVEDNFRAALSLNRKLLENQYIYNLGKTSVTLTNDFSGWAFESKGSDYTKIVINQMSLQA